MNLENLLKDRETSPWEYAIVILLVAGVAFIILFNILTQKSVSKKINEAEALLKERKFEQSLEIYRDVDQRSFGTSKYDSIIYIRINGLPDSIDNMGSLK